MDGSAGTQQQNGNQVQQSLSNAMPNQQQPDEQPVMADMQQGELGTPRNNFPPYINPYQSFANSGTMQVMIRPILIKYLQSFSFSARHDLAHAHC